MAAQSIPQRHQNPSIFCRYLKKANCQKMSSLPQWFHQKGGRRAIIKQQELMDNQSEEVVVAMKRKLKEIEMEAAYKHTPFFQQKHESRKKVFSKLWKSIIEDIQKHLKCFNAMNGCYIEMEMSLQVCKAFDHSEHHSKQNCFCLSENNEVTERFVKKLKLEDVENDCVKIGLTKIQRTLLYQYHYLPFSDRTLSNYRKQMKDDLAKEMTIARVVKLVVLFHI